MKYKEDSSKDSKIVSTHIEITVYLATDELRKEESKFTTHHT